jgi:hypothetical protein
VDKDKRPWLYLSVEYVIAWAFLIISILALIEAIIISKRNTIENQLPGLFPAFLSAVMIFSSVMILIEIRKHEPIEGKKEYKKLRIKEKVILSLKEEIPLKTITIMAFAIAYLVLMNTLGRMIPRQSFIVPNYGSISYTLGFIISTFLFLAGSICFLRRKKYLNSILIAFICVIVTYIIFSIIFKVILP